MSPKTPVIDWRKQRQGLQSFLDGRGGVVQVKVYPGAAAHKFANIVTEMVENAGGTVLCIHGDGWTRYFPDLVAFLESRLEVVPAEVQPSTTINVATHLRAGGNVTITGVTINHVESAETERNRLMQALYRRCTTIIAHTSQLLKNRRVVIVLLGTDSYDADTLSAFKTILWDGGLNRLTSQGLVLLDFYAATHVWRDNDVWPLPSDAFLTLASEYEGDAWAHAQQDLAHYLMNSNAASNEDAASLLAEGILASVEGPAALYNKLSAILQQLLNRRQMK